MDYLASPSLGLQYGYPSLTKLIWRYIIHLNSKPQTMAVMLLGIAILTLLGAIGFVVLVIANWFFFKSQEMGFIEWLRQAKLWQKLLALGDLLLSIIFALEFLEILLIFLI